MSIVWTRHMRHSCSDVFTRTNQMRSGYGRAYWAKYVLISIHLRTYRTPPSSQSRSRLVGEKHTHQVWLCIPACQPRHMHNPHRLSGGLSESERAETKTSLCLLISARRTVCDSCRARQVETETRDYRCCVAALISLNRLGRNTPLNVSICHVRKPSTLDSAAIFYQSVRDSGPIHSDQRSCQSNATHGTPDSDVYNINAIKHCSSCYHQHYAGEGWSATFL